MQRIIKYIFLLLLIATSNTVAWAQHNDEQVSPPPPKIVDTTGYYDYKHKDDNYEEDDDENDDVTVVSARKYVMRKFSADSLQNWKNDPRFKYDEREIQWVSRENAYSSSEGRKSRNSYGSDDGASPNNSSGSSGGASSGGRDRGGRERDYDKKQTPKTREKSSSTPNASLDPAVGKGLLYFILIIAAGILIYVLAKYFNNRKSSASYKNIVEVPIEEEKDIHKIKYVSELDLAISQKNYRLAVRLLYLENLKLLNDNNNIQWNIAKTNWDYLYEIQDTSLQNAFKQTTHIFDSVWYGELPLHENNFDQVHTIFKNFKKQLS
jgi:hypothetical protein